LYQVLADDIKPSRSASLHIPMSIYEGTAINNDYPPGLD
jgi:hypothetical protein